MKSWVDTLMNETEINVPSSVYNLHALMEKLCATVWRILLVTGLEWPIQLAH